MLQYVADHAAEIVATIVELGIEDVLEFFLEVGEHIFTFAKLFGATLIAYALRVFFLDSEYAIGVISKFIATLIDTVVNAVIDAISSGVSDIVSVVTFGADNNAVDIGDIHLNTLGFIQYLLTIRDTCNRLNTMTDETLFLSRRIFNSHVCPYVRYQYPVTPIYRASKFLLSPFTFNPNPTPGCRIPSDEEACAFANIYRVFQVCMLILIVWIAFYSSRKLLKYIFITGLWTAMCVVADEIHDAIHHHVVALHKSFGMDPPYTR